jgi:enamine deaminase RidA (YjgF/YER057c/UK114 family)
MESPGVTLTGPRQDRENPLMDSVSYQSRTTAQQPGLYVSRAHPGRTRSDRDRWSEWCHNSGRVVSGDLAGQARQALINLQACLREANADLDHVIRWSIMIKDGAPLQMALPPSWRSGAGGTIHLLSPSQWSAASQVRGPCAKSMRSRPSRVPNAARRLRETAHHSDEW